MGPDLVPRPAIREFEPIHQRLGNFSARKVPLVALPDAVSHDELNGLKFLVIAAAQARVRGRFGIRRREVNTIRPVWSVGARERGGVGALVALERWSVGAWDERYSRRARVIERCEVQPAVLSSTNWRVKSFST